MKFFTLPALFAAALLSAVAVVPFLPLAKTSSDLFALEVGMTASANGRVQVYFDDGTGFSESATSSAAVTRLEAASHRLPLKPGRYRVLRLDPLDRDGTITIDYIRLVDPSGHIRRNFAYSEFASTQQIQSRRELAGRLELVITPGGNDPQLTATFNPPLDATTGIRDLFAGFAPRALAMFGVLAVLLFGLDRASDVRTAIGGFFHRLASRPGRAVAWVAAVAVIASAYPVVFLDKSFVSPNHGTLLLYDAYPTLPGYSGREVVDVKGTDVGAIMWQHVPYSTMQHRALAHGELPLWNRYNSAGTPLLGQGQSMFGDPLHLFVVLCNGAAWAWDLKYLIAKWLFAFGLGLLVLAVTHPPARRESEANLPFPASSLLPALLIALAAPFLGFFGYRLNHPAFFSVCYAPWALYCWVRVVQAGALRATVLWAVGLVVANLALMNSGTVKEAYMLLLCLNFSGACALVVADTTWGERLKKFAVLAGAGVAFVLLTAPIWTTFLHSLKNSYTGYNAASAFQVQPALLLGAFDEIFYRPLMAEQRMFNPSLNFLMLLGVLYFLATLRGHFANRTALALAASSLVPLALAFGLVPAAWIVRIPFLANIAHLDNTFTCSLLVLWSVVAGVGFAAAFVRLGTKEARGDLAVAGLLLFALVFAWISFGQAAHRGIFGPNSTFTVILPGQSLPVRAEVWGDLAAMLAASGLLAWAARRALVRQAVTPALGLVFFLGLATLLWRHGLHAGAVGFSDYVAHPAQRVDFHAKSDSMEFLQAENRRLPGRGFGLHGNFFPGWTGVYGLEGIHGPDGLVNPWMRELVDASGVERVWDWRLYVEPANVAAARPFFDALNVRWYLDLASDQGVLGRNLKLVRTGDLDVYESPTAWPRAFFTDRLDVYDAPAEFTAKLKTANGRPFAAAQRPDVGTNAALVSIPRGLDDRTVAAASNFRLTENTTSFDVHAAGAGVIVLTEAWWPGDYRAEVNGAKAQLVRLNHAFKGVVVDRAGDYRVTFRYVPKGWPLHLAMCVVGALALALALFYALRPARPA